MRGRSRSSPREPERTCVGCWLKGPKGAFLRVVRRSDGGVSPDPTGRAPGRGAYVHRDERCISRASRVLPRALKASLDSSEAARLVNELLREARA